MLFIYLTSPILLSCYVGTSVIALRVHGGSREFLKCYLLAVSCQGTWQHPGGARGAPAEHEASRRSTQRHPGGIQAKYAAVSR